MSIVSKYNEVMISNSLVGIQQDVADVVNSLVPQGGSQYNYTHKRRYARTLEVLLNNLSDESRLLELGTSHVIPIALKLISPDVQVSVTDFDLSLSPSGSMVCSVGDEQREVERYSVDLESTALPVADETFDIVLCCEVLEHMDVDPMFMLAEVNRVLKPGGKLILTTPNITNSRAIWKILRGIEPYFFMQYHKDRSPYRHNFEHSVDTVGALLSGAGFTYEIWTEDTFENPVTEDIDRLINAGFKLKMERLGDNMFAVATKVSGVVDRHPGRVYV
jgi:ubiquinone/menaquinone biosynthesis C-methylase UbiE